MRLVRYDNARPTKFQRSGFSCGVPSLDNWLRTQARQSMDSRDAVTYLLFDGDRIAGYFCLSAGEVRKLAAPEGLGRRAPDPIPVVRMGRFAIDLRDQGSGWGAELLREAITRAASAALVIGARALLVDAIDDRAARFYERFAFVSSPTHPMQLLLDLRVVAASLGLE